MNTLKNVKLSELKPSPLNPRKIDEKGLETLEKSIKDFPEMLEARPLVVNTNNEVIGGNQRYLALQKLGVESTDVYVVDWSEDKQLEFMVKDNDNSGEWDYGELFNSWASEKLDEWGLKGFKYAPKLDPSSEANVYTKEQIEKAQNDLENKFSDTSNEYRTIVCKSCGKEYYVDK